ncbi:ABC transporter substrate-binding protein [Labrys portucalensis]|uniref:ABC transporter substrate-binding protein n=1 Tax=Labrys neptuniae TaxID=376174 RepID=A0ABV6ZK45_9HYPH
MRRALSLTAVLAALLLPAIGPAAAGPEKGGVIDVATIGEPPTLDPMASATDIVGMVGQHIFETLFTFDHNWNVTPLLAEALPTVSPDGKIYEIKLRQGITFHDGSAMDSADVVASLKRWLTVASRGQQVAPLITDIAATDALTVRITLKQPYSPLPALLAFNNSAAVILPSEDQDVPLKQVIGTGPYKLKERKPDQYIQLVRFEGYRSRDGEPDGYGGARKQYLDEIRFVPVPDPNTRIEGAVSGQFAYADSLPVEQFDKIKAGKSEPVLLEHFGWPMIRMNAKQGVLADMRVRKAVQLALSESDMLAAAFGDTKFYAVDGAMYPEGYPWRTDAGVEGNYDVADAEKAKAELKKAGLGEEVPLRILTSRQYEFHYKMAQVAAEYLKLAGFKVKMDVVDWATLVQQIQNPASWDIFITHSPFLPEPALINILAPASVGWWDTPDSRAAVDALNATSDPAERVKHWQRVQELIMAEAPIVKIGDFSALSAKSPKLKGFEPSPWPAFWNVYLEQ